MATIYLNNPNGQKEVRTQATDAKVYLDGRAPQPVSFEIPEEYKIKQISPSKQQPSPAGGAAAPVNASSVEGTSWDRKTTGEKLDSLFAGEHLGGGAETAKPVTEMDKWLNIGGSAVSGLERGIRGLAAVGDKLTLGGAVRGAAEGVAELTGNEALSNILDALPNPRRDFAEGQSGLSRRSQEVRTQTDNPILGAAADIAGAIGGMLPGIAASVAGGPAAGLAVMGASAGGNAYTEARKEGKGEIASTLYGGAVGASEAFLQKLLGGISAFGKSGVSKLFGDKIDDVIRAVAKNPGVQKTIQYIMGMGSEGAEEYLQSVLEPQVRNVIFGENNELGLTDPDKLYDGLVGALTGGVFELPGYVKSMRGQQNIGQSAQATTPTNTQAGQQADVGRSNLPRLSMEDFQNPNSPVWTNVDYNDAKTKAEITQKVASEMLEAGQFVELTEADLSKFAESFPDLRGMKKKDRTPILRQAVAKAKNYLRGMLERDFKGRPIEFEVNGNILEATLYDTGIKEVLDKITQKKAAMLDKSGEVFAKARYLYSTEDKRNNGQVLRWNYFYVPLSVDGETIGVRIAVRDMAASSESQIYNWDIKKEAVSSNDLAEQSSVRVDDPHTASLDPSVAETTPEVNNSIPAAPENNSPFGPNTVGAAESAFPRRTKTSQFRTNTVENTPMFTEAEKNTGFLNNTDSDFTYDVVSERQSLHEAAQRVAMDYEGEKAELPGKTIFDGTDTDTAMLILERLTQEARRTGDFSEVKSWMKMIQERGTEAGQRIQAFAKYSRTPEGTLVKAERYVQNAFEKWARDNPKLAKAMDEAASFLQQAADEYAHELPADPDEAVRNLRKGIEEIAKKRGLDDSFSKTVLEMIQDGKMNKDAASELLRLADGIPTLTTEDVGNILEIMAEAEKLPENSKERLAMENRAYKIVADKFQSSWLDMWNGWRYLAMLGNPTTHLKNRLGNTGFRAVTYAKDALGAALESGADKISRARGGEGIQRTKAVVNPFSSLDKMLYDAAGNDFESIQGIAMGGGKYNPANMIRDNMTIFRTPGSWGTAESSPQAVKAMRGLTDSFTGLLEKARIKNMDALEAADAVGVKKKYAQALAGYLKANLRGAGIFSSVDAGDVALLDAARAYAIEEAQKATFREYNAVAKKLNELKHINSKTEVIGEGLLPFTKTPANILNRAVEYSPVGLANAILSDSAAVKAGRMTAAQMIDHLASGLTGTGIMLLGALLKSLGILTASGDDDDKKRGFDEMRGAQEYALNIGEYTYTIDWAAPAVIPLFIGAELVKDGEDDGNGITLKNLLNASSKMLDPVVEMSMLKGINDAIRSAAYGGSTPVANIATGAITGYFGQGVPTLFGKVARAIDGTRRRTYADPDSPLPEWIDKPLQKAQAKLPFASGGLHPYVDQWGREQENTGGNFLGRLAYNMLSPGYLDKQESTPVDKELEKLYEATGDSGLLPGYAPKSFDYGGERVRMSGDEYTRYAKTRGQTAYSTLEDIFGSRRYGRASEEQKADMVDAAYSYATYLAKKELLGSEYNPKDRYAKIDKALKEARIDAAASILYFSVADRDGSGSISQEEAKRYLDSSGLTSAQKSYLFALTNSGWKSNPYK